MYEFCGRRVFIWGNVRYDEKASPRSRVSQYSPPSSRLGLVGSQKVVAKEFVRAKLGVMVKRILRKYGYPPDKQEKATQTVLEQAELIAVDWAS